MNGLKKALKWMGLLLGPVLAFNITFLCANGMGDETDSNKTVQSQNLSGAESLAKSKYTVLVLGRDDASGLTDVLLIVSFDTESKAVSVLQIPRDTYAEFTSAAYRKINGACDVLDGGRSVADFLEDNLGVVIDRYISVDLDAVGKIVDILGGVEIDVPFDMIYNDPYQGLSIDIRKGRQTLNGDRAKQFVRYRSGYTRGDLDRLDAQKLFLSALIKKAAEESNAFSIVEIAGTLLQNADTDISYEYCFEMIKAMGIPEMKNISFVTLPGGDIQGSSGAWYYVMNRQAAYCVIKEYFSVELQENKFDPERKFTSYVRKGFNDIYEARSGYEPKIYYADDMSGVEKMIS